MIRIGKKIRLLEWGEGTNTTNQVWNIIGEGSITRHTMRDGLTTLSISLDSSIQRKSDRARPEIKLAQQGEGMAGGSGDRWGEVALGYLRATEDGGRMAVVEILTATKIDTRKNPDTTPTAPH